MKLISCHIENFGKLSNCDFDFHEGLNSICEENGWGKSTFAAFLRAMFYGLEGKRKQKIEENEYQRYTPWQGGVFGGHLTFEVNGKIYTITRIFGNGETFELRDSRTNLISNDYSENIGEELFQVNRESFMRTVFIGQNDCKTGTTDDINSKIGNLTDGGNDMNCYEDADEILKKMELALTPKKITGSIKRREGEIAELRREVSLGESLQEKITIHQGYVESGRTALESKKAERTDLSGQQEKAAKMRQLLGKKNEWKTLTDFSALRKQERDAAREKIPGEVPALTEIDEKLEQCVVMDTAGGRMSSSALTEVERAEFEVLMQGFAQGMPSQAKIEHYLEQVSLIGKKKEELAKKESELATQKAIASAIAKKPKPISPFTIAGIVGLVLGAILCLGILALGIGVLVTGAILLAIGFFSGKKVQEHEISDEILLYEQRVDNVKEEIAGLVQEIINYAKQYETILRVYISEEHLGEHLYALQTKTKEYETLCVRHKTYTEAKAKYEAAKVEITAFLERYQLSVEMDLRRQLNLLKEWVRDFTAAEKYYKEAEEKRMQFEASVDVSLLQMEVSEDDVPNLDDLNAAISRITDEMDALQDKIREYRKILEELQLDFEEWEEKKSRLELLTLQQEKEQEKYRLTVLARKYLAMAKESITMRYAGPILERFLEYYEQIVPDNALRFHIDANTKVTAEELGKQRETDTLSAGYRDLIHICIRIAYVDIMYQEEKPMLILDDSFVNLDDKKVEAVKGFLNFIAQKYQIIYFTCSETRI